MRYIMMVTLPNGHDYENGALPSAELVEKMTRYNEEMAAAGVMLSGEGLHPTSKGVRVETKNGQRVVTDGPFAETKEVFGGFWMIKVNSKEEAVEWAKRVPDEEAVIVLRQVFDIEDFPQDVQEAAESPTLRKDLEANASA
ncbi:YciI family protein [bacterium]|nr:MAG: YciI family protein [bacterium]